MTAGDVFYFVRGVAVLVFFVVAVLQKDERPKRARRRLRGMRLKSSRRG